MNTIEDDHRNWSFGKKIPKTFDLHIKQHVPYYSEGHAIILSLLPFFLRENSKVLDIGCSTGTLANKINEKYSSYNLNIRAIDIEEDMINEAISRGIKENIEFAKEDFSYNKYSDFDAIISYYTMQFISPSIRQEAFNNAYKSLHEGGGFFLFEKVRAPDARFQDFSNQVYAEYKESKGSTPEEIFSKQKSIKGVLEPFSSQANIDMLKKAGFVDIWPIFKWICFEGFCAIK